MPPPPDATGHPLRDPAFARFAAARLLGWTGAAMTVVVLPLLVYDLSGSAALTASLASLSALAYLSLGLPAGAWADRHRRDATLIGCALLAAATLASVPVAAAYGVLGVGHVIGAAAATAALNVLADAATFGAVPALVGRAGLAPAQGFLLTAGTLTGIGAPALAGVLLTPLGLAGVLWVEAGALVVSASLYAGLRLGGGDRPPGAGFVADVREGLDFVRRHPLVRHLTLLGVGLSLAGGAVAGLQVVLAVTELGLAVDDARIGLLLSGGAVGAAAAGLALPRIQRRWGAGLVATTGYGAGWLLVLALAWVPSLTLAVVTLTAWTFTSTLVIGNGIVARQLVTPEALQGRVGTTARMVAWGGQPLGAGLAALLVGPLGVRLTLSLAATALLVSLLVALRVGLPAESARAPA